MFHMERRSRGTLIIIIIIINSLCFPEQPRMAKLTQTNKRVIFFDRLMCDSLLLVCASDQAGDGEEGMEG